MGSEAAVPQFVDVSVVKCVWVCRGCLGGRQREELTLGRLGEPPCARCGRRSKDMAAFRSVCPECRLPPGPDPDPECRTCVVRQVMDS